MTEFTIVSGLQNGQVIQRKGGAGDCLVSGKASVAGPVYATVSLRGSVLPQFEAVPAGKSVDGAFTAKIKGLPVGGPYDITLECRYMRGGVAFASVNDIRVGDVWLLAGQSNMEGVGLMADAAESHEDVRLFSMARTWGLAREPLHFLKESPDLVHNGGVITDSRTIEKEKKAALRGGGVGLHFARLMREYTGVPQGLVATAHGGTSMTQWSPSLADKGGESLYGSMLLSARASGGGFAGVLWYQGCSDTNDEDAAAYIQRMITLVESMRRDLGRPKLPFIVAQIAREVGRDALPNAWAAIVEHQRRLSESIPYLDVAATADLEMDDWIHISSLSHRTLAVRFASIAKRLAFSDAAEKPMPIPVKAKAAKDPAGPAVDITYKNVAGSLHSSGRVLGFSLAKPDGSQWNCVYKARHIGAKTRLYLTSSEFQGCSVFHGWGPNPEINSYDDREFPLPLFGPLPIE